MCFRNKHTENDKIPPAAGEATVACLYDNYAAAVYASILRLTDDKSVAAEILIETFVRLKDERQVLQKRYLLVSLLRFANDVGVNYLTEKRLPQKEPGLFAKTYPVLNCVLYQVSSLKEAEKMLSIEVVAIRKKLHEECRSIQVSGKLV